nr:copia protein [Tanacetum cinerariifolium]
MKVKESLNVTFDESPSHTKLSPLVDDDVGEEETIRKNTKIVNTKNEELCDDFTKIMHDEFEMSMMGELNFFLGLQIKQMEDGIFFNQSKYIKEMLKKFGLEDSKPTKTPIVGLTEIKLIKDDEAASVDSSKYRGEIKTQSKLMDYKRTKDYLPRIHCTKQMDEELRESYRMSIEINKKEKLQQLEQVANLNTYPSKRFNYFCYDDDDDDDYTVVITPDFLITDSLIMENEHLDTISEMESDEFIKSSVENLVSIPSESEDFSDIESECDMPDCVDSQTTKFSTISNPLFNDSTSSDDESSHEESYLLESLLNCYESIPLGIDSDDSNSEGDNLFLERLLHDDPIPLSNILDFSNVIRVFLPFFTYPVTSSILLSSGSEDTIFDPGISSYHLSSLERVYLIGVELS